MAITDNYGDTDHVVNSYDNQFYTLSDDVDITAFITIEDVLTALETYGVGLGTVAPGSVSESLSKSITKIKSDNKMRTVKNLPNADASFSVMADFQETNNPEVRKLFYGVEEDENGNQPISTSKLIETNLVYLSWDIDHTSPLVYVGRVTAAPNGDITRQGADVAVMSIMFDYIDEPIIIQVNAS